MPNTVRTPTTARFWLDRPETTKPGARSHEWKPPGACSRKNRNGFASERKVGSAGWVERFAKAIAAMHRIASRAACLVDQSFSNCALFLAWCIEGAFDLANIVPVQPMDFDDRARRIGTGAPQLLLDLVHERTEAIHVRDIDDEANRIP